VAAAVPRGTSRPRRRGQGEGLGTPSNPRLSEEVLGRQSSPLSSGPAARNLVEAVTPSSAGLLPPPRRLHHAGSRASKKGKTPTVWVEATTATTTTATTPPPPRPLPLLLAAELVASRRRACRRGHVRRCCFKASSNSNSSTLLRQDPGRADPRPSPRGQVRGPMAVEEAFRPRRPGLAVR
jgi:hypothetical protein